MRRIFIILLAVAGILAIPGVAQATLNYNSCPTGDDYTVVTQADGTSKGNTDQLQLTINPDGSLHAAANASDAVCGMLVFPIGSTSPINVTPDQMGMNGGNYSLPSGDSLDHAVLIGQIYNPNAPKGTSCQDSDWLMSWDSGLGFAGDTTKFDTTISPPGTSPLDSFSVHPPAGEWICGGSWDVSGGVGTLNSTDANGVDYTAPSGDQITHFSFAAALAPVPRDVNSVPAVPGAPTATAGDSVATLNWSPNTEADLAGYRFYDGSNLVADVKAPATSVNIVGLTNGQSYQFSMTAYDVDGNESAKSALSNVVTPQAAGDTTPPTRPGKPTATAGNASAKVTWSGSTDNVAVTGYNIFANGDPTPVATVHGRGTSVNVVGLTNGTQYRFQVQAFDAAGNKSALSALSNPVTPNTCPAGTHGTPPNCIPNSCPQGQHVQGTQCVNDCPTGTVGTTPPDCHCPRGEFGRPCRFPRPSLHFVGLTVGRKLRELQHRGRLAGRIKALGHLNENCPCHVSVQVRLHRRKVAGTSARFGGPIGSFSVKLGWRKRRMLHHGSRLTLTFSGRDQFGRIFQLKRTIRVR